MIGGRGLSFFSNIEQFATYALFPLEGNRNVVYIDESTSALYYWNSLNYVSLNSQTVWGYQDFAAGVITGTSVTLTANQNGTDAQFDSSTFYNFAEIYKQDGTDYVYTSGFFGLFAGLVEVSSQSGVSITLNKIPDPATACRIWYLYKGYLPSSGYVWPTQDLLNSAAAINLDNFFVTLTDLSATSPIIYDSSAGAFSTSISSGVLAGRFDPLTGVMQEIAIGSGLSLSGAGTLTASGSVTTVSVASANGFAGTVTNPTTTPEITISTSITGIIKGNGTAISAAAAGTDYEVPLTFTDGLLRTANSAAIDYNTTNLKLTSGQLNTIQDIAPDSTIQFGKMQIGPTQTIAATQQLVLTGPDSNFTTGPNLIAYTDADQYPVFQNRNFSHNDISINFDAYHNGVWRSSYSLSNFQIYKVGDQLKFNYAAGISAGSSFVWATAGYIDTSGVLNWGSISATTFTGALSGNATSATTAGAWTTARNLAGNSVNGSANVAFANKFIVQGTTDTGLSAAQFLGALATGLVKNTTTTGVLSIATDGTDYSAGTSALATGILKSTTGTGALTIAVAGDFPALNQNTTGSAATLTATRTLWGQNFNGSADVTGSLTSVGSITGGASNMTILSGTGNNRTLTLQTTNSGGIATTALTIGADQNTTIEKRLFSVGIATFLERVQVSGTTAPTTGAGLEFGFNGAKTDLLSYSRNASTYIAFEQDALTHTIKISGTTALAINSNSTTTFAQRTQVTGNTPPTSGAGVEMGYNSGANSAVILPIDRATNAYKLLRLNGSTHQIEILDVTAVAVSANGAVTKPLQIFFNAYKSATTTNVTGDATAYTVIFDTEITDVGSGYNNATGIFTARETGIHIFSWGVTMQNVGAAHTAGVVNLVTTSATYRALAASPAAGKDSANYFKNAQNTTFTYMTAGDTAKVTATVSNSTKTVGVYGSSGWTTFSGGLYQ